MKLSIWRSVLPVSPRAQSSSFLTSTQNSFQRVLKVSSSAAAQDLVLVEIEIDGRWQLVVSKRERCLMLALDSATLCYPQNVCVCMSVCLYSRRERRRGNHSEKEQRHNTAHWILGTSSSFSWSLQFRGRNGLGWNEMKLESKVGQSLPNHKSQPQTSPIKSKSTQESGGSTLVTSASGYFSCFLCTLKPRIPEAGGGEPPWVSTPPSFLDHYPNQWLAPSVDWRGWGSIHNPI